MKSRSKQSRAFTLAELMVVIVIIGVLAGLLLPAILKGRQNAAVVEAKGRINALKLALDQFYNDFGFYPPTNWAFNPDAGAFTGDATTANGYGQYGYSEALVQCLTNKFTKGSGDENVGDTAVRGSGRLIGNAPTNGGPYLEVKSSDLIDFDGDGFPELADPWGNPYIYVPKQDFLNAAAPDTYNAGALVGANPDPTVLTTDSPPLNEHYMRFTFQLISLGPDGWTPGLDPTPNVVHGHRYWDITLAGNPYAGAVNPALVGTDCEPSAPVVSPLLGHTDETADDINNWK